jgi:monofunctional glycosyltransferase
VPPVSTLMVARWATLRGADRSYRPLSEISPTLPAAAIASEDARFCQHGGVDWAALGEVLDEADEGGPSRGASTIPMQVAKNLFLWPSRSVVRKALEIPIALYIDTIWTKRRMIEVYLNIAEWGEGVFGAEAAARRHFGKPASDLSRREAALLVAVLPNPIARDPRRPSRLVSGKAGRIMARMAETPTGCLREAGRRL